MAPPDVGQRRSPLVLTISEVTLRPLSDFIEVAPGLGTEYVSSMQRYYGQKPG